MRKMLLTSTGFDNKRFERMFIESTNKDPKEIKVLFIPTAANDAESKEVVPFCFQDLTGAGLLPENIFTYDLDYVIDKETVAKYDGIYFCGGSSAYLMEAIHKANFKDTLLEAVNNGLFFIGVSAGSVICSSSVENSLNIFDNPLKPHCKENLTPNGPLPAPGTQINISDNQAVWVNGNNMEVIE
jgi:peptidase E